MVTFVSLFLWLITGVQTVDWGSGAKAMSSSDITKASKAIFADLEKQWIAWIEGQHLVNEIEIDGGDLGIALVGESDPVQPERRRPRRRRERKDIARTYRR